MTVPGDVSGSPTPYHSGEGGAHIDTIVNKTARARATVHLPGGIVPGRIYEIDLDSPYVRNCLRAGYFVIDEDEATDETATGGAADAP